MKQKCKSREFADTMLFSRFVLFDLHFYFTLASEAWSIVCEVSVTWLVFSCIYPVSLKVLKLEQVHSIATSFGSSAEVFLISRP